MGTYGSPHIPQKDLKVYLDVTNPDCYQANNITSPICIPICISFKCIVLHYYKG